MSDIKAIYTWRSNAELIAACAQLDYLRPEWTTLDPTFGMGTFWNLWRPTVLVGTDIVPAKSPSAASLDFTDLPFPDQSFDAVVFDPPYKLNGRPDPDNDARYGVHVLTRWQDRMDLIVAGTGECARVAKHNLLVKCQDQVVSGHVRWQSHWIIKVADEHGLRLIDRFEFLGGRPQPDGRRQVHARRNSSQLLVFSRDVRADKSGY